MDAERNLQRYQQDPFTDAPFVVEIAPETFMVVIIVDIVTRVARDYGAVD